MYRNGAVVYVPADPNQYLQRQSRTYMLMILEAIKTWGEEGLRDEVDCVFMNKVSMRAAC